MMWQPLALLHVDSGRLQIRPAHEAQRGYPLVQPNAAGAEKLLDKSKLSIARALRELIDRLLCL